MRSLIAICLIAIFSICAVDAGVEQEVFIFFRGDITGNDSLSISDPIMLSNYLFSGGPTPQTCSEVWDANTDGGVNGADPVFLLNYLFSGGSAPSPSTSNCPN